MDHQLTIFATGEALGGLVRRIATVAAGATVLYGRGIWRDDDGELLDEPSATIVTIGDSDQVATIVRVVQGWLDDQDSVRGQSAALLTTAPVEAWLLERSRT